MFIIKYYILIAVASAIAGFYVPTVYFSIALWWIALSLSAVSFAYVSQSPWIFRKNDRGNIPLYAQWIFIPFLLGAQIYNSWQRKHDSVPPIQEIDDHLFLACRLFPSDTEELKDKGVCAILDATAEFSGMNWSADDENLDYLNIPILDHQAPVSEDVIKAINWIHNHIRSKQGVVIHCALGRGRSVFLVAAYLIAAKRAKDVDSAMKQINTIRGTARLNNFQYEKLTQMHKEGLLNLKVKALLVANPVAGGGTWQALGESIKQRLGQKYQLDICITEEDKSISEQLKNRQLSNYEAIFAGGGDGTVSEVASCVIGHEIDFGILPLGTTNALSHVLYGGKAKVQAIEVACQVIMASHTQDIDLAKVNDDTMMLAAGLGFEQKMIEGADRSAKDQSGEMAYISALFEAVQENESQTYKIRFDEDEAQTIEASSIIIANASPITTLLAQGKGQPQPDDGLLDVTILNTQQSTSQPLGKLALQALSSGSLDLSQTGDIEHKQVKKIFIESGGKIDYVIDGELAQAEQVKIEVLPSAIRCFVNQQKPWTQ